MAKFQKKINNVEAVISDNKISPKKKKYVATVGSDTATTYSATKTSKQSGMIGMMRRPEGATIAELVSVTGWQHHSVRGVISGVLRKRLGLPVSSHFGERGRVYHIAASTAE